MSVAQGDNAFAAKAWQCQADNRESRSSPLPLGTSLCTRTVLRIRGFSSDKVPGELSRPQKKLARNRFQASLVDFISYVSLVPIAVVMVTIVAGINPIRALIRIWSRVSIRVIAVSVTRIAIIAARRSKPNSPNSDRNLSVRTLHGNENQSTYHQCNQKKLFHIFSFLFFIINNVIYLIGDALLGVFCKRLTVSYPRACV